MTEDAAVLEPYVSEVVTPGDVVLRHGLSSGVLAIAIGLSLWIAAGSVALAVLSGLGDHPSRRLLVGIAIVSSFVVALWRCEAVSAAMRVRPWLIVPFSVAMIGIVCIDGATEGTEISPYLAITLTPIGLAVVVARPLLVWLCVALLEAGFVAAVLIERANASLGAPEPTAASLLGAFLGYPFAAIVLLGVGRLFTRFIANADAHLERIRHGGLTLTPALTHSLLLGAARQVALLDAPSPFAALTPREIEVVEQLARGGRPKQLARSWGVSLATVRTHIKHAKRKTGARTLPELAAMASRPDWPATSDDES